LSNLLKGFFANSPGSRDLGDQDETAEFPASTPMMLVSGGLMLRVGVVSTVGRYREHNEDNYFVPGRNSVRFDVPTPPEGSGEKKNRRKES